MNEELGKFKVNRITKIEDLADKTVNEIPESDVTIQTDTHIIQMEYVDPEDNRKKTIIKPGCFALEDTNIGVQLSKFELKKHDLLETIDNTSCIISEKHKFFERLDVYKKLNKEPKRALLLCSPPGIGKSAAIGKVCRDELKGENTAIVIWDTSSVRSSSVNRFFLNNTEFSKEVEKMILVIEDIGGGSVDEYGGGARGADSSLLNLLDGVGTPFHGMPTFIIATTNNPETSVEALIDRPGRFDKVIEMKSPNEKECIELLSFISKKEELDSDDIEAAKLAATEKFSIAHIQEIIVRSMLDDISFLEVAKQLKEHKKRFKNSFQEIKNKLGLGL